jgi:hypothetical protein
MDGTKATGPAGAGVIPNLKSGLLDQVREATQIPVRVRLLVRRLATVKATAVARQAKAHSAGRLARRLTCLRPAAARSGQVGSISRRTFRPGSQENRLEEMLGPP